MDLPPIRRVTVAPEPLAEVRDEWIGHALSTEPADRTAAEAGVRAVYRKAGMEPPGTILWLGSPLAGVIGSYFLDVHLYGRNGGLDVPDRGPSVTARLSDNLGLHPAGERWVVFHGGGEILADQVRARVMPTWYLILDQIFAHLEHPDRHAFADLVEDRIRGAMNQRLGARSARQLWDGGPREIRDRVHRQDLTAVDGQRDAAELADHELNRRRGKRSDPRLRGLLQVARSAGRWWPMIDAAILTERPTELHLDDQGRPHRVDGPAIRYPDGWTVYARHGVRVPATEVGREG